MDVLDTGGTVSVLQLIAAGGILKVGLFARLFCEKFIFLGVVTQSLHINQQNTRQGALAVLEFADVDGVALILIYGQTADILHTCLMTPFFSFQMMPLRLKRFVFLRHRSNSSLSIASQRRKAIFHSLNFD